MTLRYLDHGFSRSNLKKKAYSRNVRSDWHGAKGMFWAMILALYFKVKHWNRHIEIAVSQEFVCVPYLGNGRVYWLRTKGIRVRYDVVPIMQPWTCNMGLPVGYNTYWIYWWWVDANVLQFPKCGPINGLSILWSMDWSVLDEWLHPIETYGCNYLSMPDLFESIRKRH